MHKPVVNVQAWHGASGIPQVMGNDAGIARMAVDHLLERGFRRLAYCGVAGEDYSSKRREHFITCLRELGIKPSVYDGTLSAGPLGTVERKAQAFSSERDLVAWVRSLPEPVGILACNDVRGRQLLNACSEANIRVPDQIAVIGVDNDELLCDLAEPPLSSVMPGCEQIGYESAAMLDRMLSGEAPPTDVTRIDPLRVVTRRSTDTLAIGDPLIAAALRFIRLEAGSGINVEDVLNHIAAELEIGPVSRSTLDRRFAEVLGRSPREEIVRVRLDRVKQLLVDTEHSLSEIAAMVGMEYIENLCVLFKAQTGETPGEYRRRMGGREPAGGRRKIG